MDFIEKAKGLLMDPINTFEASKDDTLEDAIKYYAVIIAVYSLISALLFATAMGSLGSMMGLGQLGMMTGVGAGIGGALVIFVMMIIGGLIGVFITGAIFHIGVYIVGGKNGIEQTIKAVMYGSTPALLLGWIPVIGGIAGLWALALEIIGIRQLQNITTGRAIIAVIIPMAILFVIAGVFAAAIAAVLIGMG